MAHSPVNVGNLFQDVNISELMKKLDILGDNGVTMSGRVPVLCPCFDLGVLRVAFGFFLCFSFFLSNLRELLSAMEGFWRAMCLWGWLGPPSSEVGFLREVPLVVHE